MDTRAIGGGGGRRWASQWLCGLTLALLAVIAHAQTPPLELEKLQRLTASEAALQVAAKGFDRVAKETVYELALTNVSGGALPGPVYATIEGLNKTPGITLRNADGTTTSGLPYILVSKSDVAGGALVTQTLFFSNPQNVRFTFTVTAYATRRDEQPPLQVEITSPHTLITVGSTPLALEGTINDANATLTVNGAPIEHDGRSFHTSVALSEGHNVIVARATNARGEEATATISVSFDKTPPFLTIDSPRDGAVVIEGLINVSGLVNDIVRGTVSEGQANVTVNGIAAQVANRSYLARGVPLQEGVNAIEVRGSDQVGNTASVTIHVTYVVPTGAHIERLSGQDQQARIRTVLGEALAVRLVGADGQPAASKVVVFRVSQGDGVVAAGGGDEGGAALVLSDGNGIATTRFRVGSRAGVGNQRVTAKAVGFEGEAAFAASATPRPGNKVSVNSGNNQRGTSHQALPLPFVVVVTDDGANVIEGAHVAFTVTAGSGTFQNGADAILATTDSDGRASATLTLGAEVGLDVQRVSATLSGTDVAAGFTASALAGGPPGQTSISGVVLDNQDRPLPNVTMRVDGTTREAKSDAQGRFKITEAPVGPVHLIADGSTTTVPGEWPTLPYNIVTVSGADNPLSTPVYLVKLDTAHAVTVGAEDKVVTLPEVPGFRLTVKAGSITFPNGDRVGQLSVTPVNVAKIPMAPPNGNQPQFIVTIQPAGARFDPPAPLQLPNVDGHPAGTQVELYSFDHDLEEFVSIGLGTVSADGTTVASNPGVGVIKAGWHGGSQPGGGGCGDGCSPCGVADAQCTCVPPPTPTGFAALAAADQCPAQCQPFPNVPHDCLKPGCNGSQPVNRPDPRDPPLDTDFGDCRKPSCLGGTDPNDEDLPTDSCKTCVGGAKVATDVTITDMRANGHDLDPFVAYDWNHPVPVHFTTTATTNRCADLLFSWDFGDGTTSNEQNPEHLYPRGDEYLVKLIVTCASCPSVQDRGTLKVSVLEVRHMPRVLRGPSLSRTELGVGEVVDINLVGPSFAFTVRGLNTNNLVKELTLPLWKYIASDVRASETIRIEDVFHRTAPVDLTFEVYPPTGITFVKVKEDPTPPIPAGQAGVFMQLDATLHAIDAQGVERDVSFLNLVIQDSSVRPTNDEGYFRSVILPSSFGLSGPTFVTVSNTLIDLVAAGAISSSFVEPWSSGHIDYVIPWTYRVSLLGTPAHVFTTIIQRIHLFGRNDTFEVGTMEVSYGDACAARKPDGVYDHSECPPP